MLKIMGPSRAGQDSQRRYLGKLAARFQEVTHAALNGYYTGDKIFRSNPDFRLVTKIIRLNEVFSDTVWKRGHTQRTGPGRSDKDKDEDEDEDEGGDEDESAFAQDPEAMPFDIPLSKHPELSGIIRTEGYDCPEPAKDSVLGLIRQVYEENRGPELGTVSALDPRAPCTTTDAPWLV